MFLICKKVNWIIVLLGLVVFFLFPFNANAEESFDVQIKVDEKLISFDVLPRINADNRTMIPVRFVSEALGMQVVWHQEKQLVTANYYDGEYSYDLMMTIDDKKGIKHDKRSQINHDIEMDTAPVLVQEEGIWRTLIPLRFLIESLDEHEITWDNESRTVNIYTKEYLENQILDENPIANELVEGEDYVVFESKVTGQDVIYEVFSVKKENATPDDYNELINEQSVNKDATSQLVIFKLPTTFMNPLDLFSQETLDYLNTVSEWGNTDYPSYKVEEVRYVPNYPAVIDEPDDSYYLKAFTNDQAYISVDIGYDVDEMHFVGYDVALFDESNSIISVLQNTSLNNEFLHFSSIQPHKTEDITYTQFINEVKYIGLLGGYDQTGYFAQYHHMWLIDNPYYYTINSTDNEIDNEPPRATEGSDANE